MKRFLKSLLTKPRAPKELEPDCEPAKDDRIQVTKDNTLRFLKIDVGGLINKVEDFLLSNKYLPVVQFRFSLVSHEMNFTNNQVCLEMPLEIDSQSWSNCMIMHKMSCKDFEPTTKFELWKDFCLLERELTEWFRNKWVGLETQKLEYQPPKPSENYFAVILLFNTSSELKPCSEVLSSYYIHRFPLADKFYEFVMKYEKLVVGVGDSADFYGSGIIISKHCVLTTWHVIQDIEPTAIYVDNRIDKEVEVIGNFTLVEVHCQLDFAILQTTELLDFEEFEIAHEPGLIDFAFINHSYGGCKRAGRGNGLLLADLFSTGYVTAPDSSGSLYLSEGKFVAMHLGRSNLAFGLPFEVIARESHCLNHLINDSSFQFETSYKEYTKIENLNFLE